MNEQEPMDAAQADQRLEMLREDLAISLHWAKDYSMESCRREIDAFTDSQVIREWERSNTRSGKAA